MKICWFNHILLAGMVLLPLMSLSQNPWHLDISQRRLLLADTSVSIQDTIIDHFVGQWCWKKEDSILEFDFTKIKQDLGNSNYTIEMDFIIGGYRLIVGKSEILNTINIKPLQGNSAGIPNSLFFYIFDPGKKTNTTLLFKRIDNDKIWLETVERQGERFFSSDKNLPFPTNIIFTRKKPVK